MSSLLVACGGDDSSVTNDLAPSTNAVQSAGATINARNSSAWVKRVFKRISVAPTIGENLASTTEVNDFVGGVSMNSHFDIVGYAKRQMEHAKDVGNFVTGVIITESCEISGTASITLEDHDNDGEVSMGDTITVIANNCVEKSETTSGQMSFTVFEDDPNFSATIVFTDFSITDFEGKSSLDGDISLKRRLNQLGSTEFISMNSKNITVLSSNLNSEEISTISNFSLSITIVGTLDSLVMTADTLTHVEAGITEILNNFSLTYTKDSNTLLSTLDFRGVFNDPAVAGGVFSVDTLQPFEGFTNADYPYTGVIKITATDNSSATLTVLDAVNVRLTVDENGDGVVDQTTDTTWKSLDI
jgi:hypothetical protein